MATRRVKSIAYDEDDLVDEDFGDYEDEDALLDECFDEIYEVYGENIAYSEDDIIDALRRTDYNVEAAMDLVAKRASKKQAKAQKKPNKSDVQPFNFEGLSPDAAALDKRSKGITKKKDAGTRANEAARAAADDKIKKDGKKSKKNKQQGNTNASSSKSNNQLQMDLEGMGLDASDVVDKISAQEKTLSATKSKSKKKKKPRLEQVPDGRPVNVNVVIIGHVDAGKSTLMGHLLFKLGAVDQRKMHKFKQLSKQLGKASFAFAYVMDEQQEERERGVTMDVGINHFSTGQRDVTILDAPGHQDFVPRMISGAAQADAAILVIDSSPNEFESGFQAGGQTREHVLLARSLGVTQLVVAVNKLDNTQPSWDQCRFVQVQEELGKFLKQAGFKSKDTVYVPCSGLTGENLMLREEAALNAWYSGPTLVDAIDNLDPPERAVDKPLRLSITDAFKDQITGTTIVGTIDSGYVEISEKLVIMPINELCTVKSIVSGGKGVSRAFAGDHATLSLSGVDFDLLGEGQIVCEPDSPVRMTSKIAAEIVVFRPRRPILPGTQVEAHINNVTMSSTVSRLIKLINKQTGEVEKKRPKCLKAGETALVEIKFSGATCVELFSDFKKLGRFTLRTSGETIAAGIITEIKH